MGASMPRESCCIVFISALALCASGGCASPVREVRAEGPFTASGVAQRWAMQARETPVGSEPALTVDRAVQEALCASPELEQIRQRMQAAGEQVRQADAAFYPRVVFTEGFNVTDNPVLAFMNVLNQRQLEINSDFNHPGQKQNASSRIAGEWSVFEGGSRWFGRSAVVNQQQSVEAELLAARNRLMATVTETYYRWLQALDFIHVADAALESARTDEQLGESRVKAEVALPSEVLRLKTQTAEQHGNLVAARTSAGRLQAALERLIARPIRPL
jgi:outer membrane protein TolC